MTSAAATTLRQFRHVTVKGCPIFHRIIFVNSVYKKLSLDAMHLYIVANTFDTKRGDLPLFIQNGPALQLIMRLVSNHNVATFASTLVCKIRTN